MARLIDADAFELEVMMMPDEELCEDCCYNVLAKLDDAPTVSGWVSVKERMPEPEENVIIWTKTGCMKYAQYHEDGSVNPWYVYEDNARAWTNVISHWIPLPEPPEVNDNG